MASPEQEKEEKPLPGGNAVRAPSVNDTVAIGKEAALTEVRAAVAEVRQLASQENKGVEAIQAAKVRVATAIQKAQSAGVSQEELLAASKSESTNKVMPGDFAKADKEKIYSAAFEAARVAAEAAKDAGKPDIEIVKAAAAAAKAAGGDPKVAAAALKSLKATENNDSSSSSSDSSSSEEDELPIAAEAKAKAKREGIAAAFYFGVTRK